MKKIITIMLALALALSFAGCSAKEENTEANSNADVSVNQNSDSGNNGGEITTKASAYKSSGKASGKSFDAVINANEYVLYNNIFYNKQGAEYDGKPVIKEGIFAILFDEYSKVTRYYVWGYYDNTKCCDWQWEFKPENTSDLPPTGSHIEVSGTFTSSSEALDGYWITNPKVKVKKEFKAPGTDVDMSTMSATLERVEAANINNKSEGFEGKTVITYGRVLSPKAIQSPYYDNDYELGVDTEDEMPAIGTMVLVTGTIKGGIITNAKVELTEDY